MDLWKIIIIIILIIVIIIGITNIYFKTDVLYDSILDCNNSFKLIDNLKKESSANMSFSMWYFINDFTTATASNPFLTFYNNTSIYDEDTITALVEIFDANFSATSMTKSVTDADLGLDATSTKLPTIHICLNKNRNDVHIYVRTSDNNDKKIISRFVLKNIPLQKWVNLTITIDNNVFDVYLDGKLHNSFILPDALFTESSNMDDNKLYLNGIDGSTQTHNTFLTRIRYIDSAVTTTDAYDIYKDGIDSKHSTSLFNKYNLKVSFLEYNQEKSSFLI
tara:strand:+ start:15866 stop:16699 length:834 start_codon:yes stop_codon:yes gene_type:complete